LRWIHPATTKSGGRWSEPTQFIYYTERRIVGWPVPHTLEDKESVEVVYVDHNHFHMAGNPDFGPASTHY